MRIILPLYKLVEKIFTILGPDFLPAKSYLLVRLVAVLSIWFMVPFANADQSPIVIKQQTVTEALTEFADKTGLQMVYPSDLTEGLVTPGATGYSPEEILKLLLAGTDLTYEFLNPNTVTLIKKNDETRVISVKKESVEAQESSLDENRKRRRGSFFARMVAAIATGIVASGASTFAAAEDTANAPVLEEVYVTAEKRTTSLNDTPIALTVVDDEFITKTQIINFDQLARHTPNMMIEDSLGSTFQSISTRGVRTPGSQAGFESSTAIVIDDVYQARPAALAMALSDVESVEVLRGPQGALYGRNASAGVLKISTQRPTDYSAYGELYGGNNSEVRARGAISGSITDQVQARANLYYVKRDTFAEAVFPGSKDQELDRLGFGVRFAMDFDNWSADLILRRFESDDTINSQTDLYIVTPALAGFNEFVMGKPILNDDIFDRKNAQDFPGYDELTNNEVTLKLTTEFGDVSVESITGYADYKASSRIDADNTSASGVVIGSDEDHRQLSEELRLRTKLTDNLDVLVGVYGFFQDFKHSEPTILGADWATFLFGVPGLAGAEDNVFSHQETTNYALFSQFTWAATEDLTVTIGARVDSEDKDYSRVQPLSFLSNELVVDLDRSVNNVSGTASAIYALSDNTNIYASVNRGVKSGGFNFGSSATAADIPFDEEEAVSYEVGLRGDYFDQRLRLAATIFNSRFSDLQVTSFDGTTFRTQNAARAKSTGLELEVSGLIGDGLQVGGVLGTLDAEYTRFATAQCAATDPNAADPACTQDLSGRPLAYAPDWSGSVYVDYDWAIANNFVGNVRVDVSHRGEHYLDTALDPNSKQSATTMVNLRVSVSDPSQDWEVALVANNLFDEEYLQAFYNYPFFAGSYTAQPGQPRMVGLVLRKQFN